MHYKNKRVLVTGASGFIGKALVYRLNQLGANVCEYDLRRDTYVPEGKASYVFHFGSSSSQILFKRNMLGSVSDTINSFKRVNQFARNLDARLIYPSTGLCSTNNLNEYARTKKLLEDIHLSHNLNALGLRIFATYGPGEEHKALYASVPHIFSTDVIEGRKCLIYGDGMQSRDFIYIDDVIESILILAEHATEPIIEIGSGQKTSFNELFGIIRETYRGEDCDEAIYVPAPQSYITETKADTKILHKYYKPETYLDTGISELIKHIIKL